MLYDRVLKIREICYKRHVDENSRSIILFNK